MCLHVNLTPREHSINKNNDRGPAQYEYAMHLNAKRYFTSATKE